MYKILSLDGGGSWALMQLLTLKERFKDEIPELNGHAILQQFDMVIANSGGSIVLAALSENWSIDKALSLFDDKVTRERIFSKNSFMETFWPVSLTRKFSFGPKYSTKRKGDTFKDLFPKINGLLMNELPEFIEKSDLKITVCTYDALNNRAKFFRSYANKNSSAEFVTLTQAIHGSSNAPVQYFDFPARFRAKGTEVYYELWDGALGGFNNPVTAGIIEAFRLGIPLDDITVVSLGNGNKLMSMKQKERFFNLKLETQKYRKKKLKFGKYKSQFAYFKETVMNQAKTILYQPPDWANFVALMFLSKSLDNNLEDRFIRLSPMIHIDENTDKEAVELLNDLYSLDMDLTSDRDIDLLKKCFEFWRDGKIRNQPIQYKVKRDNELIYYVGDEFFKEGVERWRRINN